MCIGGIGWVCMGGIGCMSVHRALDGSWVYMWPTSWTMVPVKPQQALFPIPLTGLGSTQTTLLAGMDRPYALYAGCCLVGERPGLCLFITALVGFIPGPVAGGFHLVCIQSAIWLRSIFTNT